MVIKPGFKYFIIVLLSIGVFIGGSAILAFSFYWGFIFNLLIYAALTFFVLKKYGYKRNNLIALVAPLSIDIYIHLADIHGTLISFPIVFAIFLGIISGIVLLRASRVTRSIFTTAIALFAAWVFFYGYTYFLHKLDFGTFDEKVSYPAPAFSFVDKEGNTYSKCSQVTVIDFWTTHCGVCFRKFPLLEKLYTQYKSNPKVRIYSVNVPLEGDTSSQAFNQLAAFNYTFPMLQSAKGWDETAGQFNLVGVPTVFVVDKNNVIKFKGDLEGAEAVIKKLVED